MGAGHWTPEPAGAEPQDPSGGGKTGSGGPAVAIGAGHWAPGNAGYASPAQASPSDDSTPSGGFGTGGAEDGASLDKSALPADSSGCSAAAGTPGAAGSALFVAFALALLLFRRRRIAGIDRCS